MFLPLLLASAAKKVDGATETNDLADAAGIPEDELKKEFDIYATGQAQRDRNTADGPVASEDAREHLEDLGQDGVTKSGE